MWDVIDICMEVWKDKKGGMGILLVVFRYVVANMLRIEPFFKIKIGKFMLQGLRWNADKSTRAKINFPAVSTKKTPPKIEPIT